MAITRIDRLVAFQVLRLTLLVLAVVGVLSALFLFIDNQHDVGTGQYSLSDALWLALILLPTQLVQLMPIAALLGALLGLGQLARENAWIVARSVGVSPWRLALAAGGAGLFLAVVSLSAGEFINPSLTQWADQWRAEAKGLDPDLAMGSVVWVRDGSRFVRVERPTRHTVHGGIDIFNVQKDGSWTVLESIDHAKAATVLDDGNWKLNDIDHTQFSGRSVSRTHGKQIELDGGMSSHVVSFASVDPDGLAMADIVKQIGFLRENGQQTQGLELSLYNRVSHACATVFLSMLAVAFLMGAQRGGNGLNLAKGIGIGLVYFLITRTVETGGSVYGWSAGVVAVSPLLLLGLVTSLAISRAR